VKGARGREKPVTVEVGGEGSRVLKAEVVLSAVGRVPAVEGLGLEDVGVRVEGGRVAVDQGMRTTAPGVYAVGDMVGGGLAHEASAQGIVAAENAMGLHSVYDGKALPRCVFTTPEVAAVGLTERQAAEKGVKVKVGRFSFAANPAAVTSGEVEGLVKVVGEGATGEILGVHIIGPRATDLISVASVAMRLEATAEDLAQVIFPHPTYAEALKEAFLDLAERPIHKARLKR